MDSVKSEERKLIPSLPKIRYTPYTLKLYRRLRRVLFPGRRLDRMARGAREALERCEQIGKCNLDT
jgi:hypothetical protein